MSGYIYIYYTKENFLDIMKKYTRLSDLKIFSKEKWLSKGIQITILYRSR